MGCLSRFSITAFSSSSGVFPLNMSKLGHAIVNLFILLLKDELRSDGLELSLPLSLVSPLLHGPFHGPNRRRRLILHSRFNACKTFLLCRVRPQAVVAISWSFLSPIFVDFVQALGLVLAVMRTSIFAAVFRCKNVEITGGIAIEVDFDVLVVHRVLVPHIQKQSVSFYLLC